MIQKVIIYLSPISLLYAVEIAPIVVEDSFPPVSVYILDEAIQINTTTLAEKLENLKIPHLTVT